MELTKKLLTELQSRLKIGNRRGVHLNAIPRGSKYKFDLHRLSYIDKNLPQNFVNALLKEQPLRFKISWKENVPDLNSLFVEDQAQLVAISKSFDNLINQTEAIESEKGINTFGFGFPLLVRRNQSDNKLTVAPVLIWSLRIKRPQEFNTWIVQRNEDDPIYINEILINYLQGDAKVTINQVSSEMLEDGLIDKEELLNICVDLSKSINSTTPADIRGKFKQELENVKPIPDKEFLEKLTKNSSNSLIEFRGLFSIFEVQKQNIIKDYDELIKLKRVCINQEDIETSSFQALSSVETDPSQQNILNSIVSTRNTLIQGPPGTGKSQSLTAILINSLESHKKAIVVCEKRTALEVLYNALNQSGLGEHCILIKDTIKDRKSVVNSVRDRIDNSAYGKYNNYSKEGLDSILKRSKSLIDDINGAHQKIGKKLLDNYNWTNIIGLLLSKLKSNNEDFEINFDKTIFKYNSNEFNDLCQLVHKGQILYNEYLPYEEFSFLNPLKLESDNPFKLEQTIKDDFKKYLEYLSGDQSIIHKIRLKYKNNPDDLFNIVKTNRLSYRLASIFSKRKKQLLIDQKQLLESCTELAIFINNDGWYRSYISKESSEMIINEIESMLKKENEYFNDKDDLFSKEFQWFKFYNVLPQTSKLLLDCLRLKKDWEKVFVIYYLNSLLINSATNDSLIHDSEYKQLTESLSYIGKEQIKYIKGYWCSKQIAAKGGFHNHNANFSVENLYNKRSSSKYKRFSLRQIVKFDPTLFTTFFPIILTTPDVCSNLFMGMNNYFDIVLFDEASQLRLEDTLPALLKGKQIIVAGDEHQMPPSNYFDKILDGTIEDEEDVQEDENVQIDPNNVFLSCESLLDFGEELGFEKKYLDFHYRSRHPDLIEFSNHAFYNERLMPLPNDFEYTAIKYIQVNGTYSGHSNEREAEAVLSIIENNIHRLPDGKYPSVGVATFNIEQRNLIKSKIIERQKFERYADFNQKILELEASGMFIKNLENIQGDERDVIILSTTFGTTKDGRFTHHFGPINQKKGYRLLNVIITRAKFKVYVCTSIPEQAFLNFRDYLVTERANNGRAVFFAYLAYAKAVSEKDLDLKQSVLNALVENSEKSKKIVRLNNDLESPFEEEVYYVLAENFDESKLIPQLQFAGFRIDIVYDSGIKGIPKIAVECDGASYHSSREAYLYDICRQKRLEEHGFVFHRIWSTNWWRNPTREANNLIEFIRNVESKTPRVINDRPELKLAFMDEPWGIKNLTSPTNPEPKLKVNERVTTLNTKNNIQPQPHSNLINAHSKVKVKYINNGKDLTVQLIENTSTKIDKSNGIQKVSNQSPLAISLIGKSVGETVKVGNLDNYVEILGIEN